LDAEQHDFCLLKTFTTSEMWHKVLQLQMRSSPFLGILNEIHNGLI